MIHKRSAGVDAPLPGLEQPALVIPTIHDYPFHLPPSLPHGGWPAEANKLNWLLQITTTARTPAVANDRRHQTRDPSVDCKGSLGSLGIHWPMP